MAAGNAPLSHELQGQARGLDVRIAEAAAAQLGRPLRVVFFDTEYEKESSLGHEVNALLSSGVCARRPAAFPWWPPTWAHPAGPAPARPTTQAPNGAASGPSSPWASWWPAGRTSRPRWAWCVVRRRPAHPPPEDSLQSLAGKPDMMLGVTTGTLAGTVAMTWRFGALRNRLVTVGQRDDLARPPGRVPTRASSGRWCLWRCLMAGAWRTRRPGWRPANGDGPSVSTWALVTLKVQSEVRRALDLVISDGLADGRLQRWATEEGLSWSAPAAPDVGHGPSLASLAAD